MKTHSPLIKKSVIFFAVFSLWIGVAALFPQSLEKGRTTQAPRPASPATTVQPKPKAAAETTGKEPISNSEIEKLKADQEKTRNATEVAREWFRRLNALDGSKDSVDRFLDLYQTNALQVSGPRGDDQMGPSTFEGRDMIRKFAEKTSKDYSRLAYFIRQRTVNNKTAELLVANVGPWGDVSLALEFSGSVNIKENGKEKRFTVPGAAFFDISNGKISRIRVIYANGESFPVGGTWILSL